MKKIFGIGWYDIPMILLVMSYTLLSCSVIYWVLYCIVSYLVARYNALLNISIFRHFLPSPSVPSHSIPVYSHFLSFSFPIPLGTTQLILFFNLFRSSGKRSRWCLCGWTYSGRSPRPVWRGGGAGDGPIYGLPYVRFPSYQIEIRGEKNEKQRGK